MAGTILYIEDNPDNTLLVRRAIEARGYTFLWAADGLSGIEQVESARPDLILLDINLPDIDGYEVARRLRARANAAPIIAITANALRNDVEKALACGCSDYLSKPISLRELWAHVTAFLPA